MAQFGKISHEEFQKSSGYVISDSAKRAHAAAQTTVSIVQAVNNTAIGQSIPSRMLGIGYKVATFAAVANAFKDVGFNNIVQTAVDPEKSLIEKGRNIRRELNKPSMHEAGVALALYTQKSKAIKGVAALGTLAAVSLGAAPAASAAGAYMTYKGVKFAAEYALSTHAGHHFEQKLAKETKNMVGYGAKMLKTMRAAMKGEKPEFKAMARVSQEVEKAFEHQEPEADHHHDQGHDHHHHKTAFHEIVDQFKTAGKQLVSFVKNPIKTLRQALDTVQNDLKIIRDAVFPDTHQAAIDNKVDISAKQQQEKSLQAQNTLQIQEIQTTMIKKVRVGLN